MSPAARVWLYATAGWAVCVALVVAAGVFAPSSTAAAHTPYDRHRVAGVSYPPFWGQVPPPSCLEDMPCWVGSDADGRTDQAALNDWEVWLRSEPTR